MSPRRTSLPILVMFVAQVFPIAASIRLTPEGVALWNIRSSINAFESKNGRLPESWRELEDEWRRRLDVVFPDVLPTRRYEWFSPPLELRIYQGRSLRVVAMTRKPMWEKTWKENLGRTVALKGPGRHVIHRSEGGSITSEWFPETAIQRLWPSAGRTLPVPDDEPERPWVTSARWQIIVRRAGIVMAVVLVVWWMAVRVFGKRRNRAMLGAG